MVLHNSNIAEKLENPRHMQALYCHFSHAMSLGADYLKEKAACLFNWLQAATRIGIQCSMFCSKAPPPWADSLLKKTMSITCTVSHQWNAFEHSNGEPNQLVLPLCLFLLLWGILHAVKDTHKQKATAQRQDKLLWLAFSTCILSVMHVHTMPHCLFCECCFEAMRFEVSCCSLCSCVCCDAGLNGPLNHYSLRGIHGLLMQLQYCLLPLAWSCCMHSSCMP